MRRCANRYGHTPSDDIGVKCNIMDWQLDWMGGRIVARSLRRRPSNEKQVDGEGKRSKKSRLGEHDWDNNDGSMNSTNAKEGTQGGCIFSYMATIEMTRQYT